MLELENMCGIEYMFNHKNKCKLNSRQILSESKMEVHFLIHSSIFLIFEVLIIKLVLTYNRGKIV